MYWMAAMERKPAPSNYRKDKDEISTDTFYDISRGSDLLFKARSGCLGMHSYKARYSKEEKCTSVEKVRKQRNVFSLHVETYTRVYVRTLPT